MKINEAIKAARTEQNITQKEPPLYFMATSDSTDKLSVPEGGSAKEAIQKYRNRVKQQDSD